MIKKIIFISLSIIIGAIVYILTIGISVNQQQIKLLQDAFATSDYTTYLSYNMAYFAKNPVFQRKLNDYRVTVYEIVGEDNNKSFCNFVIFINELDEDVFTISSEYEDPNDLTNMTVETDGNIYDYRSDLQDDVSITYGYSVFKGLYYIYQPLEDDNYTFRLYNYEGEQFCSFTIMYEYPIDQDSSLEELETYFDDNDYWNKGYSNNQKLEFIREDINRNMLIYGAFVIIVGLFIFRKSFVKRKNQLS